MNGLNFTEILLDDLANAQIDFRTFVRACAYVISMNGGYVPTPRNPWERTCLREAGKTATACEATEIAIDSGEQIILSADLDKKIEMAIDWAKTIADHERDYSGWKLGRMARSGYVDLMDGKEPDIAARLLQIYEGSCENQKYRDSQYLGEPGDSVGLVNARIIEIAELSDKFNLGESLTQVTAEENGNLIMFFTNERLKVGDVITGTATVKRRTARAKIKSYAKMTFLAKVHFE